MKLLKRVILLLLLAVPVQAQPLVPYAPAGLVLVAVYVQTLTPAASSAAIQTAEQTFTVSGLTTSDAVLIIGPAPTSLCPPVHARVSAANTLAIAFSTLTAAGCTPAAGSYTIMAWRRGG